MGRPRDLKAMYQQCQRLSAWDIVLLMRQRMLFEWLLGQSPTTPWLVAGVLLALAIAEIQQLLKDMGPVEELKGLPNPFWFVCPEPPAQATRLDKLESLMGLLAQCVLGPYSCERLSLSQIV